MRGFAWACGCALVLAAGCAKSDSTGSSGSGTLTGKVFDGSGTALSGVTVETSPATSSQTTDGTGAFTFTGVATGTYAVVAKKSGYVKSSASAVVEHEKTTTVNLSVAAGPSYAAAIQPIFNANCTAAGCHSASAPSGNYNLTTYAGATAKNVIAFDADGSLLVKRIAGSASGTQMPQGASPLSAADQTLIKNWINAGAPNN